MAFSISGVFQTNFFRNENKQTKNSIAVLDSIHNVWNIWLCTRRYVKFGYAIDIECSDRGQRTRMILLNIWNLIEAMQWTMHYAHFQFSYLSITFRNGCGIPLSINVYQSKWREHRSQYRSHRFLMWSSFGAHVWVDDRWSKLRTIVACTVCVL